jgi:hypothetical protein
VSTGFWRTGRRWEDEAGTPLLDTRFAGTFRRHLEVTVGPTGLPGPEVVLLAVMSRHLHLDVEEGSNAAFVS